MDINKIALRLTAKKKPIANRHQAIGGILLRLLATWLLPIAFLTVAHADTIWLKNGRKLHGTIIKEDKKEVTIEIISKGTKGTIIVKQEEIVKIEKNDKEGPVILPPSKTDAGTQKPDKKKPGDEPQSPDATPPEESEKKEEEEPLDPELRKKIEEFVWQLGHRKRGWRGKARAELAKTGKPAVPFLIKAVESGRNSKARWGAAQVLGNIGDKRATEPLIKHLRDSDQFVRKHSAEALRKITTQNFGFDPEGSIQSRDEAASKWEEWWKKKKEEEKKRKEAEEAAKKATKDKSGKPEKKPGE